VGAIQDNDSDRQTMETELLEKELKGAEVSKPVVVISTFPSQPGRKLSISWNTANATKPNRKSGGAQRSGGTTDSQPSLRDWGTRPVAEGLENILDVISDALHWPIRPE